MIQSNEIALKIPNGNADSYRHCPKGRIYTAMKLKLFTNPNGVTEFEFKTKESDHFHLILQPILARCTVGTGWPLIIQSSACLISLPVTGIPLPGLESSSWPR